MEVATNEEHGQLGLRQNVQDLLAEVLPPVGPTFLGRKAARSGSGETGNAGQQVVDFLRILNTWMIRSDNRYRMW